MPGSDILSVPIDIPLHGTGGVAGQDAVRAFVALAAYRTRCHHTVRWDMGALQEDALKTDPAMIADDNVFGGIEPPAGEVHDAVGVRAPDLGAVGKHTVVSDQDAAAFVGGHVDGLLIAAVEGRAVSDPNLVSILFDVELDIMGGAIVTDDDGIAAAPDEKGDFGQLAAPADDDAVVVSADVDDTVAISINTGVPGDRHGIAVALHADDAVTEERRRVTAEGIPAACQDEAVSLGVEVGQVAGIAVGLEAVSQTDDHGFQEGDPVDQLDDTCHSVSSKVIMLQQILPLDVVLISLAVYVVEAALCRSVDADREGPPAAGGGELRAPAQCHEGDPEVICVETQGPNAIPVKGVRVQGAGRDQRAASGKGLDAVGMLQIVLVQPGVAPQGGHGAEIRIDHLGGHAADILRPFFMHLHQLTDGIPGVEHVVIRQDHQILRVFLQREVILLMAAQILAEADGQAPLLQPQELLRQVGQFVGELGGGQPEDDLIRLHALAQQGLDGQVDRSDPLGVGGQRDDDPLGPLPGCDAGAAAGESVIPPGKGDVVEPLAVTEHKGNRLRYGVVCQVMFFRFSLKPEIKTINKGIHSFT